MANLADYFPIVTPRSITITDKALKFSAIASRAVVLLMALWLVVSCKEETEIERTGAARITPRVVVDPTVFTSDGMRDGSIVAPPEESEMNFTLSADDGRYDHTWNSIINYPLNEILRPGLYTASVQSGGEMTEGLDMPYFYGEKRLSLLAGDDVTVEITATLAQSVVDVELSERLRQRFATVGVYLHSEGYSYIYYGGESDHQVFIHPGNITVALKVATDEGEATVKIAEIPSAEARHLYTLSLDCDNGDEPTVKAVVDGAEAGSVTVTGELLRSQAPVISSYGVTPGVAYELSEGVTPTEKIGFKVDGPQRDALTLSTIASSLNEIGWPRQIDFSKASEQEISKMEQLGLKITRNSAGDITDVDLTEVLGHLRYSAQSSKARFVLQGESVAGKLSEPVEIGIDILPVDITVGSMSNVIIGVNTAELVVTCHANDLDKNIAIEALNEHSEWVDCTIKSIERRGGGDQWAITFTVPEGSGASLPVRVKYCGSVLVDVVLRRVSPEFTIEADAYALSAAIRVTSSDPSLTPLITSLMRIYVNGQPTVAADRRPDDGMLYIGTLEPDKKYQLTATLVDNPASDDFTAPIEIRTESTLQVENSNFEDHHRSFKFDNLPSGGRYSQSIADIFNMQNYTSFDVDVPRKWADTNAKTFCKSAANPNTWYMAPSVISDLDNVSDYCAVKLQSVAWDINGEAIPDYRQSSGSYLAYNPNVPHIAHRSAGKLFLGRYAFDPTTLTETYKEGIEFSSRPVAINGNYHFTPAANDLNDCGLVIVEVLGMVNGRETVIASSRTRLTPALTYTAFSAPLTYDMFGVKATKLKIMLSSSQYVGDINYESAHIVTFNDSVRATSVGGTLWVQDLTLSYF